MLKILCLNERRKLLIFLQIFVSLFLLLFSWTAEAVGQVEAPAQIVQKEDLLPEGGSLNKSLKNRYSFFLHKRNFLLPASHNWRTHNDLYSSVDTLQKPDAPFYDKTEAEFQISFFAPLVENLFTEDLSLLLAYTHHAWWQLYNATWSKPFRETNYTPELFLRKSFNVQDGEDRRYLFIDLGYVHESNGQFESLSRSWDRLFLRSFISSEKLLLVLSTWYRLPEKQGEDENPGIEQYYGYGELSAHYALGSHTVDFKLPFSKSPGVELGYSFPIKDFYRFYVNYKYGYGHSLIEYNRTIERVGIGITLEGTMDRR